MSMDQMRNRVYTYTYTVLNPQLINLILLTNQQDPSHVLQTPAGRECFPNNIHHHLVRRIYLVYLVLVISLKSILKSVLPDISILLPPQI